MNGKGNIIALIIIVVLLVGMMIFSYMRKKKYNNELGQMRKDLKIGDKVMTDTGVVGTLVDTYEEEGYQYFVLKSGAGNHFGYFAVHANAIYYVFGKDKAEKKPNLGINQKDKPAEQAGEQPNEQGDNSVKPAEDDATNETDIQQAEPTSNQQDSVNAANNNQKKSTKTAQKRTSSKSKK